MPPSPPRRFTRPLVAGLASSALVLGPAGPSVLAAAVTGTPPAAARPADAPPAPTGSAASVARSAPMAPPAAGPVSAGSPSLEGGLADLLIVIDGLLATGAAPETVAEQVALLTPADLAVLAAHPDMLQPAGNSAAFQRNLLLGLLLLGGIIALAAASDGSSSIMVN